MNKIYKVVWNAARGCYVVGSELIKTHQGKKSVRRGGGKHPFSRGDGAAPCHRGLGRSLQFHLCGRDSDGSE